MRCVWYAGEAVTTRTPRARRSLPPRVALPSGTGDPLLLAAVMLLAGAIAAGCATGGTGGDPDSGGTGMIDARVGEGGVGDSGPTDARMPIDSMPDMCGSVVCDAFERCVSGACVPYPACAGDGSCPMAGDVCRSRYCVPGDVDIDGDGSPAADDCDETNPDRSPLATEICNMIDEDCDTRVDEGDPTTLCATNPGGGICMMGSCGCPAGTYDLDRTIPGCECVAMPPLDQGTSCAMPIDLGMLSDSGQRLTVSGNVMPDTREVWYSFRAIDTPDTACDNFHVRVQLTANPADTFEFTVFEGACTAAGCADSGFTDYRRATDFRMDIGGMLTGECPCTGMGAAPMNNVSVCSDNSQTFYVRVRRRAGSMLSCVQYTLELSNGVYDS